MGGAYVGCGGRLSRPPSVPPYLLASRGGLWTTFFRSELLGAGPAPLTLLWGGPLYPASPRCEALTWSANPSATIVQNRFERIDHSLGGHTGTVARGRSHGDGNTGTVTRGR